MIEVLVMFVCDVRISGRESLQDSYSLLIDGYCAAIQALLLLRDEDAGGENFVAEVERPGQLSVCCATQAV
jgi:hypothetical protein